MNNRYAGIIENDVVNGEGICVSFFVQGCRHHCPGCFNPETWDFNGGKPLPANYKEQIYSALVKNGIKRNLSILGGDPLEPENQELVEDLIIWVKEKLPDIKIYLWTGSRLCDLLSQNNTVVNSILNKIDFLIDGPFIKELKDLTLSLRGSKNQNIWRKTKKGFWYLLP